MSIRVVASLKVREIVTASRGLSVEVRVGSKHRIFKFSGQRRETHYAGQPRVKLVLDILVVGSSISISVELSTVGSHSFLNSGVTKIDFHESRGIESSGRMVTSS
jgi:hypothetical protein